MNIQSQLEISIRLVLKSLSLPEVDICLEHPADEKFGDYSSNIALTIFSKLKTKKEKGKSETKSLKLDEPKSPRELAEIIVKELKKDTELKNYISKIEIAGPGFINFWLSQEYLTTTLTRIIETKEKFGSSEWGTDKTWLIEHTSPNPNKAMHLGHLRNNLIGMAIANTWEFLGINVVRDAINNNRGIAIAKLMWGYMKFAHKEGKHIEELDYWYNHQDEWKTPESVGVRPDRFIDELYVRASEDVKDNEIAEKRIRQLVIDWEQEDEKTWALWDKVLQYSYEGQQLTFNRLGNKWDHVWHEHEHYKQGKEFVEEGLERRIFRRLDTGVVLTNLKKYNLPDTVLLKSDGTALYITQDLVLTQLKREKFHPDKLFWVIGPEQSLALQQLFAVYEQLGIGKREDYTHIAFGYMSIKGKGKMSSREGNVVYIDDLIDEAKKRIAEKIDKKRFEKSDLEHIAEIVGLGAVKYSILKVGRLVDIAFDFEESINFDGNSGPYLQYTYARCQSVLRKAEQTNYELPARNASRNMRDRCISFLK
ncbi:MAG: arginyl-tRNA synthetase [Microgenomates group bacterium GW2011_GWC1_41_8]|nr:MAG: arginyl-tRNA synthetase [Microgenomates group bacterium GW2011_GWC1_41_8]